MKWRRNSGPLEYERGSAHKKTMDVPPFSGLRSMT